MIQWLRDAFSNPPRHGRLLRKRSAAVIVGVGQLPRLGAVVPGGKIARLLLGVSQRDITHPFRLVEHGTSEEFAQADAALVVDDSHLVGFGYDLIYHFGLL